jgi:LysM repeat protein
VLRKSADSVAALISRGLEDLRACTALSSDTGTVTSDFEDETLINKLIKIASQIRPDPFFESNLEENLAANHQPKTKWALPLQQFSTVISWVALISLTFFLLYWRVGPNTSITRRATAHPTTQDVKKNVATTITSTPPRPTASPTSTDIPLQEYIVQAGDTCTYIANKFGVTIDLLITLNRLNNTCDIWADQKLKIPLIPISTPSN